MASCRWGKGQSHGTGFRLPRERCSLSRAGREDACGPARSVDGHGPPMGTDRWGAGSGAQVRRAGSGSTTL